MRDPATVYGACPGPMIDMETLSPAFLFSRVREARPLVHHITNCVTVNDCANVTLAVGAAPVMADAPEEVAEMAGMADALVLNIGTLSSAQVEAMLLAGQGCERTRDPGRAGPCRRRRDRLPDGNGASAPRRARYRGSQGKCRRDRDDRRDRGHGCAAWIRPG